MFFKKLFVVFLLFIINLSNVSSIDDSYMEKSLYQVTDFVQLLDASNIYSLTNNSEYPWIINFYLHHCGHCRKFSKTFKRMAREVSGWKVNIGVINCAINETLKTCLDFNMKLYPTIAYIPSNQVVDKDNVSSVKIFDKSRSLVELRNLAVDLVMNNLPKSTGPITLDESMMNDFYSNSNGGNLILAVYGDDEKNHLANTLYLDTQECIKVKVVKIPSELKTKSLQAIGASSSPDDSKSNKKKYLSFGIKNTPKLSNSSLFAEDSQTFVIATRSFKDILILSEDQPANLTQIRKQLYRNFAYICPNLAAPFLVSTDKEINNKNVDSYTNYDNPVPTVQELHMEDFIGAVSTSIRYEVSRRTLDKKTIPVLIDWLNLVSTCIPFPSKQIDFIQSLLDFVHQNSKYVDFDHLNTFLSTKEATDALPIDPTWINCAGSDPTYRGYPCSMWLTAHTMLIQCENKDPTQKKELQYDATDVLKIFRSYIDNFFSCSYCRDHFLEMSKDVAKLIKTPVEAIKWAWVSHNRVNARLRKDDSADPSYPKIQFPSKALCPECHNLNSITNDDDIITTKPGFAVPDQQWNWPAILMFLRSYYSSENILLAKDNSLNNTQSAQNNSQIYQSNSNNINFERNVEDVILNNDFSYSLKYNIFYLILSIVIVVILFAVFQYKIKKKYFNYQHDDTLSRLISDDNTNYYKKFIFCTNLSTEKQQKYII